MKRTLFSIIATALTLSGCGSSIPYKSGITTIGASEEVEEIQYNGQQIGHTKRNASGNGYAWRVGASSENEGFAAYAGLLPGTNLDPLPDNGTATMRGHYVGSTISASPSQYSFEVTNGENVAHVRNYVSDMEVNVDFGSRALTGESEDGRLSVTGQIANDGSYTGSATFNGMSGDLIGLVDSDEAIGTYAGSDDSIAFAGGYRTVLDTGGS